MHLALMLAFLVAFNVGPNITSARAQNGCMPALSAAEGARQYAMASNARIENYLNEAKNADRICAPETFRQIDRNIAAVEATAAMAAKVPNRCTGVPRRQAAAELQEIAEKEVVRKRELRTIFTQSCEKPG